MYVPASSIVKVPVLDAVDSLTLLWPLLLVGLGLWLLLARPAVTTTHLSSLDDAAGPAPVLHLRAATVFGDLTVRAAVPTGGGPATTTPGGGTSR